MYNFIKNSHTEVFQKNVITGRTRTLNLDINYKTTTTRNNKNKSNSKNVNSGDKTNQYHIYNNANSSNNNLCNHINNNNNKTFKNQVLYWHLSFFIFFGVVFFRLFVIDHFHVCLFVCLFDGLEVLVF